MDALSKLGLKRRVIAVEIEGFGKVHLRDLTISEWRSCIEGDEDRSRKLLSMSLCNEAGDLLFDEQDPLDVGSLPPVLVQELVNKVAFHSRLSEDASKN